MNPKNKKTDAWPSWVSLRVAELWRGDFYSQADAFALTQAMRSNCAVSRFVSTIYCGSVQRRRFAGRMTLLAELAGVARSTAFSTRDRVVKSGLVKGSVRTGRKGLVTLTISHRHRLYQVLGYFAARGLLDSPDVALAVHLLGTLNATTRRVQIESLSIFASMSGFSLPSIQRVVRRLESNSFWRRVGDAEFEFLIAEHQSDSFQENPTPIQRVMEVESMTEIGPNKADDGELFDENASTENNHDRKSDSFDRKSDPFPRAYIDNISRNSTDSEIGCGEPSSARKQQPPLTSPTPTTPLTPLDANQPLQVWDPRVGDQPLAADDLRSMVRARIADAVAAGKGGLSGRTIAELTLLACGSALLAQDRTDSVEALNAFKRAREVWPVGVPDATETILVAFGDIAAIRYACKLKFLTWPEMNQAIEQRITSVPRVESMPAQFQTDWSSRANSVITKLHRRMRALLPANCINETSSAGFFKPYIAISERPEAVVEVVDFALAEIRSSGRMVQALRDLRPALDQAFPEASKGARRQKFPSQQKLAKNRGVSLGH